MMFRPTILLFSVLLFPGCTLLESYSSDVNNKVESYIRDKQYQRALSLIDYVGPTNINYSQLQKRRKQLLQIISTYEIRTVATAQSLARKQEWYKALALIEDAMHNLPHSEKLQNTYHDISARREAILQEVDIQLALNHANKLSRDIPLLQKTMNLVPDQAERRYDLDNRSEERNTATQLLLECAQKTINEKRYSLASECVEAGYALQPDKQFKQQLDAYNSKIVNFVVQQQNLELQSAGELLEKLRHGYSYDNLAATREMIDSLTQHNIKGKKHSQIIQQLSTHLSTGIEQRIATGQQLYSAGKIQEALAIWHELNNIDPDNSKLQSYIDRAERVLDKLQTLSKDN